MKKIIFKLTIIVCLMFLPMLSNQLFSQPLPPTGTHGADTDQPPGAPLDGGLSILVVMAAAYGSKKIQLLRKNKKEDQ